MSAPSGSFIPDLLRDDLLDEVLIRVERLWRHQAGRSGVDDLVRRHPKYSLEIQEFYTDLMESGEPVDEEFQEAEDSVYQWLRTSGIDEALAAAVQLRREVTPTTTSGLSADHGAAGGDFAQGDATDQTPRERWLPFLGKKLGRKKSELVASLPNVTLELLSLVSRYPHLVPDQVKEVLSHLVQEHLGVSAEESLEHLSKPDLVFKRAASRREPGGGPPENFEQLLERAALKPAAKVFWRECAQKAV